MPAGEESAMTSGRRVQCPWTSPDKVTLPPTTPRVGGLHPSPWPRACTYDVTRARAPRHALAPRLLYGHVPSTASPPTLSLLSVEHREILIYMFLYGDELPIAFTYTASYVAAERGTCSSCHRFKRKKIMNNLFKKSQESTLFMNELLILL